MRSCNVSVKEELKDEDLHPTGIDHLSIATDADRGHVVEKEIIVVPDVNPFVMI